MSTYTDVNTPVISQITLPSGNTYYIADREIRNVVQNLSETVAGGVSFNIVWTQANYTSTTAPTAATLATIPAGVIVYYNSGASSAIGTLAASATTKGTFYLVYSETQEGNLDYYNEYATITTGSTTYTWEKIGDTQVDLSGLVASVAVTGTSSSVLTGLGTPSTESVVGTGATFSATDPTISVTVTPSTTYLGATATAGSVTIKEDDPVYAITGYSSPTTDTFVKSVSAETGKNLVTTSITPAGAAISVVGSVTDNTQKLSTTTVTGVQSSTTIASKATAATSQTTADGTGTASTTNTDWLKGISVSNEILTIGAATLDTQTTTQYTFSDVTVPIKNSSSTTVATGSLTTSGTGADVMTSTSVSNENVATVGSAVTVATGATDENGTGDAVVTGVTIGSSGSALTGLGTATTDKVIGFDTTFTFTNPTIKLSSNSSASINRVQVATGISSATGSASGTAVQFSDTDPTSVISSISPTNTTVVKSITVTPTMEDGTTGTASTYTAA